MLYMLVMLGCHLSTGLLEIFFFNPRMSLACSRTGPYFFYHKVRAGLKKNVLGE